MVVLFVIVGVGVCFGVMMLFGYYVFGLYWSVVVLFGVVIVFIDFVVVFLVLCGVLLLNYLRFVLEVELGFNDVLIVFVVIVLMGVVIGELNVGVFLLFGLIVV